MNHTVAILHPLTEHATPFPPNSPQVQALVERTMDWERNTLSSSARTHSDHPVGSTSATCERYAQEGLWPSGVPGVFLSATPGENKFPPVATPKNIEPSRSSVKPEVRFAAALFTEIRDSGDARDQRAPQASQGAHPIH